MESIEHEWGKVCISHVTYHTAFPTKERKKRKNEKTKKIINEEGYQGPNHTEERQDKH